MSQDNLLRLKCTTCKRANYYTSKNKKKVERKLEFKKFCKWCHKHTPHKEARMTGEGSSSTSSGHFDKISLSGLILSKWGHRSTVGLWSPKPGIQVRILMPPQSK